MYAGKPVIGIVGGIGSGKSFIADLFGELGCLVIKSDQQVYAAYRTTRVIQTIRSWWGNDVFTSDGQVDRTAIATRVFQDPAQRKRLEELIHPIVSQLRDQLMQEAAANPALRAIIWDTPLLYEVNLDKQCDAVVFVDSPLEIRLKRVRQTRNWDQQQLLQRENSQLGLDKKKNLAQYIVDNTADAAFARRQVETVLSRILTKT